MKTNKRQDRIQNSIKLAERTLKNLAGAPAEYVALAEKNLASLRAMERTVEIGHFINHGELGATRSLWRGTGTPIVAVEVKGRP